MRSSPKKLQILEYQTKQLENNNGEAIIYMLPEVVERFSGGLLTVDRLKELRRQGKGPTHSRTKRGIVYHRDSVVGYLNSLKVVPDAMEMLHYLQQPNQQEQIAQLKQEIAELRAELMIVKLMASEPKEKRPD